MSKRVETYQAYVAAEERLINVFSPLNNEATSDQQKRHNEASSPQEQFDPAIDSVLHIISDNSDILSLMSSDDDDIFKGFEDGWINEPALTAAGDVTEQHIFGLCRSRQLRSCTERPEACNSNMTSAVYMDCLPPKNFCPNDEVVEIDDDSPDVTENTDTEPHGIAVTFLEEVGSQPSSFVVNTSNTCNFDELGTIMINGNASNNSEIEIIDPSNDVEQVIVAEQSEEVVPECIIYDSPMDQHESNVVVLTDANGCEVYVSAHDINNSEQMAHAFLMRHGLGLLPQHAEHQHHQMQLNGESYITEVAEDQPNADAHNVYLSDAALEQQEHHLYVVENDAQLEEERPDDCPVFEHELEELHDECVEEMHEDDVDNAIYEPEMQQISTDAKPHIFEQREAQIQLDQTTIVIADDVDSNEKLSLQNEEQHLKRLKQMPPESELMADQEVQPQLQQSLSECENSGTTEFPVSSTSMPNGSEYDEYDDDLPDEQQSAVGAVLPPPRKYPPLLKNTLPAEALDRKLANISQTQPQMTLFEKIENWNCSTVCDPVEDVENFEMTFEQHESCNMNRSFVKFHESLNMDLKAVVTNTCEMRDEQENQNTVEVELEQRADLKPSRFLQRRKNELPGSNDLSKSLQTTQRYKRLLNIVQNAETHCTRDTSNQEDIVPIELTDDDDGCVALPIGQQEVQNNASESTLTPEPKLPKELTIRKAIQTQTSVEQIPSTAYGVPQENKETSTMDLERPIAHNFTADEPNVRCDGAQMDKLDGQAAYTDTNAEPNETAYQDEMMYEQHKFCNYLGLTELSTAVAVCSAMRELANNMAIRRTLRVRTQQQMDRMRSSVRANRRERLRAAATTSSELSTQATTTRDDEVAVIAADNSLSPPALQPAPPAPYSIHESESNMSKLSAEPQQNLCDVLHKRVHTTPLECNPSMMSDAKQNLNIALAKAYAAAVPAQDHLHETMQHRLKQSREVVPSIFIVKAMNNGATQEALAPKPQCSLKNTVLEDTLIQRPIKRVTLHEPEKIQSPKSKKVNKKLKRRRTTTAAVSATRKTQEQQQTRDLVTRSTTHNNSKLLRNRKVNLLKTYELSDVSTIRKKRLSGGSTSGSKQAQTPKLVKAALQKTSTKPSIKSAAVAVAATNNTSESESKLSRKSIKIGQSTAKTARAVPYGKTKHDVIATKLPYRMRAKSLPIPASKQDITNVTMSTVKECPPAPTPSKVIMPNKPQIDFKNALHMDDFIINQAIVRPPVSPEAQRLVLNARKMKPVSYQESISTFANLSKPATVLLQPQTPGSNTGMPGRPDRQIAGFVDSKCTKDKQPNIALTPPGGLMRLTNSSHTLRNPLLGKHGKVLYMYYELDQLIVLQEKIVTFWKYSKVFNVLHKQSDVNETAPQHCTINALSSDSERSWEGDAPQWVHLGRARRLTADVEIATPFSNRLCAHNSTPVYVEMRCKMTDHHKRESTLLSLYVNVYYYCEEEMRPKMHSVHLDSVTCDFTYVIYTTITESRYFVMAWQQEMIMGKPRSGICKYSLTPNLDTLASIREFKQLRKELNYIECLTDDRLIGYGSTHITIWDHRSGDTLMNYDLGFYLGRNLGAIHYPSFDMDQSNMLILYQHIKAVNKPAELHIIACEISHTLPSHRVLHVHPLPSPQFDENVTAINTGEHLIIKSRNEDEIWISSVDQRLLTYVAPQGTQRFYTRYKSQIIELGPDFLMVDSIANHMLKLATKHQQQLQ